MPADVFLRPLPRYEWGARKRELFRAPVTKRRNGAGGRGGGSFKEERVYSSRRHQHTYVGKGRGDKVWSFVSVRVVVVGGGGEKGAETGEGDRGGGGGGGMFNNW